MNAVKPLPAAARMCMRALLRSRCRRYFLTLEPSQHPSPSAGWPQERFGPASDTVTGRQDGSAIRECCSDGQRSFALGVAAVLRSQHLRQSCLVVSVQISIAPGLQVTALHNVRNNSMKQCKTHGHEAYLCRM